ncbi:MAG: 1-acyl-sn-glycerol-3-phosphate acyltransferase [Phyllobacteriaceae bacterium]|nr:1-acyl-sn-glycerol-3-phosphate acyltransferase [Phyllobacteriaceae bacterium]
MRHLRASMLLLAFLGLTLPLMPLQQLLLWFSPKMAERLPHWYHRSVARLLGIDIQVSGPRPVNGPAFVIANHVSWLDIIVLSAVAPVSFVAKQEVARWPFFGTLARLQRTVFVDRDRRHSTGKERDSISDRLKEGGMIVLFPEGTSGDGRSILPFRSSYFGAVHDPEIPVIPVTLAYTESWGLPLTPRELPRYAWYGDMDLPPHLWNAVAEGPLTVEVIFHAAETLHHAKARKTLSAHAEGTIRGGLVAALHGRGKRG